MKGRRLCGEIVSVCDHDDQHGFKSGPHRQHFETDQIPTVDVGCACWKPRSSR